MTIPVVSTYSINEQLLQLTQFKWPQILSQSNALQSYRSKYGDFYIKAVRDCLLSFEPGLCFLGGHRMEGGQGITTDHFVSQAHLLQIQRHCHIYHYLLHYTPEIRHMVCMTNSKFTENLKKRQIIFKIHLLLTFLFRRQYWEGFIIITIWIIKYWVKLNINK
jgi:hypothetical protein